MRTDVHWTEAAQRQSHTVLLGKPNEKRHQDPLGNLQRTSWHDIVEQATAESAESRICGNHKNGTESACCAFEVQCKISKERTPDTATETEPGISSLRGKVCL